MSSNSEKLQYIEECLIEEPESYGFNQWNERMIRRQERLLVFYQRYWGKYYRKKWLTEGDRNSKFFHQNVKNHKNKNSIVRILDSSGTWIDKQIAIQDKFVEEFKNRLIT